MSSATIVPASNVSSSKQSVKRSHDGHSEEVVILAGATVTAPFEDIAEAVRGVTSYRRPNRSRPVNQPLGGFATIEEKLGWESASDEAWDTIDAQE